MRATQAATTIPPTSSDLNILLEITHSSYSDLYLRSEFYLHGKEYEKSDLETRMLVVRMSGGQEYSCFGEQAVVVFDDRFLAQLGLLYPSDGGLSPIVL